MDNLFFPFDLSDFPTVDKEKRRDEIIEATKALNKMIKDSRNQAKQSNCYYCGNDFIFIFRGLFFILKHTSKYFKRAGCFIW